MSFYAIAIDGPAASGKSTMARAIASRLGIVMVNSGAMYRAVTWKILSEGIDPKNTAAVIELLDKLNITCDDDGLISTILIDDVNPESHLRNPEINGNVSVVSAIPEVREKLVCLQRDYLKRTHVVMEGRDIGSVSMLIQKSAIVAALVMVRKIRWQNAMRLIVHAKQPR
jgi:cytidylate kinase